MITRHAPTRRIHLNVCFQADNEGIANVIGMRVEARSTDTPSRVTRQAAKRLGLAFELQPVCFWTLERGRVDARLDWPLLASAIPSGAVLEARLVPPPPPRAATRRQPVKGG